MDNQIVIHATDKQKRIALIENGELAQFFIDSPENRRSVGDIYLAQVHKVMGGIRAAFIDLSTPKDAFLHYSDLGEHLEEYLVMLNGRDSVPQKASEELREFRKKSGENKVEGMSGKDQTMHEQNLIGNLLKPGQKIMVQVVKEPIGSKGPRVSTDITLAGRFLVLIPFGDYVAVSKRIRSFKERRRLRSTIGSMLPSGFGVIVRTVSEGQPDEALVEDLKDLHEKWIKITEKLAESKPTTLLHNDLDMTESLVRDLFSKNYNRILIDDPESFKLIRSYVSRIAPSMVNNVVQHKSREHIFDYMKISKDIDSVFSPRVKMPSGGYLIFEQTEAMYVVDVNSGRYAAKKEQEDNSLKTNLEAAREIAKQLRLRDIGGIIVVDFIDLQDDSNRKKIYDEIRKEFKKDRAKTNILPMSDFGLMQITRQRIRPSVVKSVSKVCTMCGGSGSIVSENTLLSDIQSWLQKFRNEYSVRNIDLYLNPYFHSVLTQGYFSQRIKWMFKFRCFIHILPDESISLNDYKVTIHKSEVDISTAVLEGKKLDEALAEQEREIAELESEGKRDPRNLDFYKKEEDKKNGRKDTSNQRQQRDNRQNDSQANELQDDSAHGKSRKPNARIAPNVARGRDKSKAKYFKSTDEQEAPVVQAPPSTPVNEPPVKPVEKKPDALEVAKAYAKKRADEIDQVKVDVEVSNIEESTNKTVEAIKVDAPKEVKEDFNRDVEVKIEADKNAVKLESTSKLDTATSSETQIEEPQKKVKAPVRVKKPAKNTRRKATAKEAQPSDASEKVENGAASSKDSQVKNVENSNSKKDKELAAFEEAKATLSEDQFRKPVDSPASEGSISGVKKSTVKKRATPTVKKQRVPDVETENKDETAEAQP